MVDPSIRPDGWPTAFGKLYIFRSDWNPTGSRFITYLKSTDGKFGSKAYSLKATVRTFGFFYDEPSPDCYPTPENYQYAYRFHLPTGPFIPMRK